APCSCSTLDDACCAAARFVSLVRAIRFFLLRATVFMRNSSYHLAVSALVGWLGSGLRHGQISTGKYSSEIQMYEYAFGLRSPGSFPYTSKVSRPRSHSQTTASRVYAIFQ